MCFPVMFDYIAHKVLGLVFFFLSIYIWKLYMLYFWMKHDTRDIFVV